MIRFFRKIRLRLLGLAPADTERKSFLSSGKFNKYLVYALGEIFLVMIGILLALKVNNWNEDRKHVAQESLLLKEMSKNLRTDLEQFESDLLKMKLRLEKISHLHSLIRYGRVGYSDTLNTYFGAVYGVEKSDLNAANYEDLKSRGFDLIRDDSLRFKINQFFEKTISRVTGYERSEAAVNEVMKPYYLQNFFEIDFKKYAVPINPAFLLEDVYYQNLVHYRIINLKSNQLTHHPQIIKDIKDLRARIDDYLENT